MFYQTSHFQKYQTTTAPSTYEERSRGFDLDAQNLMFNATFDPSDHMSSALWELKITPILGGGIGLGVNTFQHFLQVAYDSINEVGSVISVGTPVTNLMVAWQAFFAFRLKPENAHFSFDLGYRYNGFGKFTGPTQVMTNVGGYDGALAHLPGWTGRLQTNSVYLSLTGEW
jgi:hypothetical protein